MKRYFILLALVLFAINSYSTVVYNSNNNSITQKLVLQ